MNFCYEFKLMHFSMLRNELFQPSLIFWFSEVEVKGGQGVSQLWNGVYQLCLQKGYGQKVAP